MKTLKRKKLDIPAQVSNRPVTNRGVHLQPFGYHGFWLDREIQDSYWTNLLKSMGISWVVILTEGDSVLEDRHGTSPLKVLLDAGIIPIIRDKQELPNGFFNGETVKRTTELYAQYGLRPFWQLYNEPFDPREWRDRQVPGYNKAWRIIAGRWSEGARQVVDAGAYVGFPDGPCYAENPFERLRAADGLEFFEKGLAFYAPHNYGLGRPLWYPYDAVTRHAAPLTEEAYRRLLDDFADLPNWHDDPVEVINEQRQAWADPTRTAITDDTCWRGWEKIVAWSLESLGFVPPMAMTEGGWTPRARAGVAPVDNRWSYATPWMVAKKTLQMYDTPSPLFAICPWLLASKDMGGTGWFDDAWHGSAFSDQYGRPKPVITVLQDTRPKEIEPRTEPMVIDVDGDTRDWEWVGQAYGASYRRATSPEPDETTPTAEEETAPVVRLIEVHEYEGPATLDVVVVDGNGLPVEGVEFYYYRPDAPPTEEPPEHEWYDRAVPAVTDAAGRISFPVMGAPCTPHTCHGIVWPKGRGDVLENLGLLVGTANRHLNSVWRVVAGGVPPTEGNGPESESEPDTGPEERTHIRPDEESSTGWQMTVEHRPGARIIAGSLPSEGIDVTITDAWGNASTVTSGSKLDHGPGGFEVVTPHVATYTLAFLDEVFEVQTHDGVTFVTFRQAEEPGPGPTDSDSEGEPGDESEEESMAGWQMTVEHRPGTRIIAGSLPSEGIDVTITDPWGNASTVTSGSKLDHGPGGFEVVAPHVVTYTLAFLDETFEVQTHDGVTFVTFSQEEEPDAGPTDPDSEEEPGDESEEESAAGWQMTVEHRPGPRIIAGSLPSEGIDVTIADPWGNASTVTSGSKLDHGPGGFEVVAPHVATYTLAFLDKVFEVQTHDGATFVTFTHAEESDPDSGPEIEPDPETKGNKLGFYCEVTTTPGLVDAIREVQPPTLLTHANDRGLLQAMRRHLSPETFVVGRLYVDRHVQDAWLNSSDPEEVGRAFAEQVLGHDFGMALERGENGHLLIDAWMTLNECLPGPASNAYEKGTAEERAAIRRRANAYDRFQVAFRDRLKEADSELEAVAFNFGAGNFVAAGGYLDWFPRTLASYVYLGFHEYGWPALSEDLDPDAASSAGTYRSIMQGIRERHGDHLYAIITEAGLARMFKHAEFPPGDVGWLYRGEPVSQQDYWRSLEWYNGLLCEDDFVLGACLFEVGLGGQEWETFRHLGVDNEGNPLQLIPWIKGLREPGPVLGVAEIVPSEARGIVTVRGRVASHGQPVGGAMVRLLGPADTLGSDPRAAIHSPSAVTWTQAITGFQGSVWNCWQRFVARQVAGTTWEEFSALAAEYNPSLRESDGRFEAGRIYYLPENWDPVRPEVIWDHWVDGFAGNRWVCWKTYVRAKVVGLNWEVFREEVVARNPYLAGDGYRFVAAQAYRLPRSAGRNLYYRVDVAGARGRYDFAELPIGSYTLEVSAGGYQPLRRSLDVDTDLVLDLELEPTASS